MTTTTTIDDIPDDIVDYIFSGLPAKDLAACECVSARFRLASLRAPLKIHVVPSNERLIRRWAASRAHRVVKISSRRVPFPVELFRNVMWIDVMYTRMAFPDAVGTRLRFLRLSRVVRQFGTPDVFSIGAQFPPSLTHAFLTFDDSFRRVDVVDPGNVTVLEIRAPYNFLGRPNIRVCDLGKIADLTLNTSGSVAMNAATSRVKRARIEAFDTTTDEVVSILAPCAATADVVVVSFPRAVVDTSELVDAGIDPRVLAIEAAFVNVDAVNPRLRTLEIRAERLATTGQIPARVHVVADVDGRPMPREFFSRTSPSSS
jgi:hypothetical protein